MALRSTFLSRSPRVVHLMQLSNSRPSLRLFSDQGQGKVLEDEQRARETVYVKKMEKEMLEKQKQKIEEKEKAEKEKTDVKKP